MRVRGAQYKPRALGVSYLGTHLTHIKALVIPATPSGPPMLLWSIGHGQAGIQSKVNWIPAYAGMTVRNMC